MNNLYDYPHMDELMKHLRLTSQTINLFAAWPTDSNSLDCVERGGGEWEAVTSESDAFVK